MFSQRTLSITGAARCHEGGLLDVNVAGFPQSVVSTAGLKASQGLVDLGLIPGVADAETFVKTWRNFATGQTSADYLAYLGVGNGSVGVGGSNSTASGVVFNSGPKSGFLKSGNSTTSSDNRVLSRQDLIRLANRELLRCHPRRLANVHGQFMKHARPQPGERQPLRTIAAWKSRIG